MKAPRPLTYQQEATLTVMGTELYEYLLHNQPETYSEMQQDGSLLPYLQRMGEELDEMVISLMQNGMDEAGAKELARAEFNPDAAGIEIPDEEPML